MAEHTSIVRGQNDHPEVLRWVHSAGYKLDVPDDVAVLDNVKLLDWMLKNSDCIRQLDVVQLLYKNAAKVGDLRVIKWLWNNNVGEEVSVYAPSAAARHGQKHILQWFFSIGLKLDLLIFAKAAKGGHFELLKWLRGLAPRRQCAWDKMTFRMAAKHGDVSILKWLRAEKCPTDSNSILYAVEAGKLDAVKWLHSTGIRATEDAWNVAADFGQLEVLKWLHKINCPRSGKEYGVAARSGRIDVIKWLMENKMGIRADVCSHAASGGHLNLIKWLRSKNCPWNENVCYEAVASGHIGVLIWARENGCPCDVRKCMAATTLAALKAQKLSKWDARGVNSQNGLNILKYFYSIGFIPNNPHFCKNAAEIGDLEMLKWLRDVRCPWIIWDCLRAAEGHDDVIKWLRGSIVHKRAARRQVDICNTRAIVPFIAQ